MEENKKKENNPIDVTKEAEKSIIITLSIGFSLGIIGLIGYPFSIAGIGPRLFYIGLLIAIAAFISGFFTGTLFGMPKRNDQLNSDYSLNNSLVEISDWLTKIIVGLGLVNLKQIPKNLMSLGKYVNEASGGNVQSMDVFTICVVVYFAILGLYIGYNYMRLVLSQKYKLADDNILRKELIKKDIETQELKTSLKQKQSQADSLLKEVNQPNQKEKVLLSDDYVITMKEKAQEKFATGLISKKNDPQKEQWGGLSERNSRKLDVTVKEIREGLYRILITILSTDPNEKPLEDGEVVLIALHPSFGNPPFRYLKVKNGLVELSLLSYGSFTIGALVDRGKTELELDLAELPNVTEYFKRK